MSSPRLGLLVLFLALAGAGRCQSPTRAEFAIQNNGLIYADSNMQMLGRMVDSLNLRFKHCDLTRNYYSNPQGTLWHLRFAGPTPTVEALRNDLRAGKPLNVLLETYKSVCQKVDTGVLVIEQRTNEGVYYLTGDANHGYDINNNIRDRNQPIPLREWVVSLGYKGAWESKANESGDAWYLPNALTRQPIPAEYARYLQYVDCMVDTNTTILLADSSFGNRSYAGDEYKSLMEYLNRRMQYKRRKGDPRSAGLTQRHVDFAIDSLRDDRSFRSLLDSAVRSAAYIGDANDAFGQLIAAFYGKKKVLEMKRRYRVMGLCSMDPSPRIHALEIALLAAETNSWDIFLRAHLDIMNDHFDRRSDGSYAWGRRKTYLKELEELHLDVVDLMLGLALRADNLPQHHYYGTVWRLGWALTESKDRAIVEERVSAMIKDQRLDAFNRGLLNILYTSYRQHLDDKKAPE